MDEGLDLARDCCWADASVLYRTTGEVATQVAHRPAAPWLLSGDLPGTWFPWGLAPLDPQRFLLISDARCLPAVPGSPLTMGALGVRSCLHLPVREGGRTIGALQLLWSEPRLVWDDDRGRLLRLLGGLLLGSSAARALLAGSGLAGSGLAGSGLPSSGLAGDLARRRPGSVRCSGGLGG